MQVRQARYTPILVPAITSVNSLLAPAVSSSAEADLTQHSASHARSHARGFSTQVLNNLRLPSLQDIAYSTEALTAFACHPHQLQQQRVGCLLSSRPQYHAGVQATKEAAQNESFSYDRA